MKIEKSINYTQAFFPTKKSKKLHTRTLTKMVSFSVRELTEDQFPVAFKVKDYKSVAKGAKTFKEVHDADAPFRLFTETVRRFGNKFFLPVRVNAGSAISTVFENPESYVKDLLLFHNSSTLGTIFAATYDQPDTFVEGKSIVYGSSLPAKLKEIRNQLKKFVICKGILWEETPEPLYTYTTFGCGNNHGGTGFFINYGKRCRASRKIYWKADQRDQAIKAAVKAATDRGDTKSVKEIQNTKLNIEVVNA